MVLDLLNIERECLREESTVRREREREKERARELESESERDIVRDSYR